MPRETRLDEAGTPAAMHIAEQLNRKPENIRRIIIIGALAFVNAIFVGFIAKLLIMLVTFFTNLFFFGTFSFHESSPADNTLGAWVIAMPVIGGLIVGLMARFGSKAIRGHGIPEAMEKIITDESRIPPMITILKPLSAAISIGSGGPFGAEGPIISTGGALGSFCGQTLHITAQERKVLLAAGATAGMTAIFGTPFAAILLAIELLLFEFSAKSFLPVMIACITGACMHFLLFSVLPTFPMPQVPAVNTTGVLVYAGMGVIIGLASVVVTKSVYWVEDIFEKLPIHWMWWPAIGGVAVGVIGLYYPQTLGVGYSNITDALSGTVPIYLLISLCFWKFLSWAIALGSGTSGGTLAPLLTIGSALGCLLGMFVQRYLPDANVNLPMAALVGMAALFAGASRAILTSIVFAMETTMQERTLLPLIAGCSTAYLVSFLMMRSTIMTEKIKRRGILMPEHFRPDMLTLKTVLETMDKSGKRSVKVSREETIGSLRDLIKSSNGHVEHGDLITIEANNVLGIVKGKSLFEYQGNFHAPLSNITDHHVYSVYPDNSLEIALEIMLKTKQRLLPVVDRQTHELLGVVTEWNILRIFEKRFIEDRHIHQHISIADRTMAMLRDKSS